MGSGCRKCAFENRIKGFGRNDFIDIAEGRECILYIIKCEKEKEIFYKVGITSRTIEERYKDKKSMPYQYTTIFSHTSLDAGLIWDMELEMKNKYKKMRHFPEIEFAGRTECFTIDLPVEEIILNLEK